MRWIRVGVVGRFGHIFVRGAIGWRRARHGSLAGCRGGDCGCPVKQEGTQFRGAHGYYDAQNQENCERGNYYDPSFSRGFFESYRLVSEAGEWNSPSAGRDGFQLRGRRCSRKADRARTVKAR
jgi:hypothetical protein